MTYTTKDFSSRLDFIFETQLKNILNEDEFSEFEKINDIKAKLRKETGIELKCILKENMDINNTTQLDELKIKSKTVLEKAMKQKGDCIALVYKKSRIIHINGHWDNISEIPMVIKETVYVKAYKGGLCGLITERGDVHIKPVYYDIDDTMNEVFIWVKGSDSDYGYGLINENGVQQTPFNFFMSGKQLIKMNDSMLILGKTSNGECLYNITENKIEIPGCKYKKIQFNESTNNFIAKDKNNQIGIIKPGCVETPPMYDQLNPVPRGFQVTKNKKIGVINEQGDVIIPIIYDIMLKCTEDELIFVKEGKIYTYNKNNEVTNGN